MSHAAGAVCSVSRSAVGRMRHREGGPAVEDYTGCLWGPFAAQPAIPGWCLHGCLHREDGPAVETSDGIREWWINGDLHREDGPACEWSGIRAWCLDGDALSEQEHARASRQ